MNARREGRIEGMRSVVRMVEAYASAYEGCASVPASALRTLVDLLEREVEAEVQPDAAQGRAE